MVSSFSAGSTTRDTASRQAGGLGRDDGPIVGGFQTIPGGSPATPSALSGGFSPIGLPFAQGAPTAAPPTIQPMPSVRFPPNLQRLIDFVTGDFEAGGFKIKPKKFKEPGTGSKFFGLTFTKKF